MEHLYVSLTYTVVRGGGMYRNEGIGNSFTFISCRAIRLASSTRSFNAIT